MTALRELLIPYEQLLAEKYCSDQLNEKKCYKLDSKDQEKINQQIKQLKSVFKKNTENLRNKGLDEFSLSKAIDDE